MASQRWQVGAATVTAVVEDETHHIPPEIFFPGATAADIARYEGLVPDYADDQGNIAFRVQAFVIEHGARKVLVDPCVGNGKKRAVPFWNEQSWPFLERFVAAGFSTSAIDTVVHTHLHADHVGWDTHLEAGTWVPTFTEARHLYTPRELDTCRGSADEGIEAVYDDSVEPILAAGLADLVDEDADLGDGLTLEPSTGHTPGHVSLWLESDGGRALLAGDFLHHPVQCAWPDLAEVADADIDQARATRHRMLERVASTGALMFAAHFATQPAGRVVVDGAAFRFEPVR